MIAVISTLLLVIVIGMCFRLTDIYEPAFDTIEDEDGAWLVIWYNSASADYGRDYKRLFLIRRYGV